MVIKTIKGLRNLRWRRCAECGYAWLTEESPVADNYIKEYIEYIDESEPRKVTQKTLPGLEG